MADMSSSGSGLPVTGVPPVSAGDGGNRGAAEGSDSYGRNVVAEERRQRSMADFRDFVSMLDIPAEELTEAVRAAFQKVFAELSEREDRIEEMSGRIEWLSSMTDAHPFLPVMNRRAFVSRLARVLDVVRRSGGTNALLYVETPTVDRIRRERGHDQEERALRHASDMLAEMLSPADAIGALGGSSFGIVLFDGSQQAVESFIRLIGEKARAVPYEFEGESTLLEFDVGVTRLKPEDSPKSALDAADRSRLSGDDVG
jgi:diguanylate cyclase (GGDEF)-like protein